LSARVWLLPGITLVLGIVNQAWLFAGAITGVTASAVGDGGVFWVCAWLSAVAALLALARAALPAHAAFPALG
jgi:hypothetical protein